MKKKNLKVVVGFLMMSLFLIVVAPNDANAQHKNRKDKPKKTKVETPVKHYKNQPRRGEQVTKVPKKAVVVRHRNSDYHYEDGIFYRSINGIHVVTTPPVGLRIATLPPKSIRVMASGRAYFYYFGTYYKPVQTGEYEVATSPVGARIDALPDGYDVVELEGKVYYRLDETYYKAVVASNGNVLYEVVRI